MIKDVMTMFKRILVFLKNVIEPKAKLSHDCLDQVFAKLVQQFPKHLSDPMTKYANEPHSLQWNGGYLILKNGTALLHVFESTHCKGEFYEQYDIVDGRNILNNEEYERHVTDVFKYLS
jgi:hypothetical protein